MDALDKSFLAKATINGSALSALALIYNYSLSEAARGEVVAQISRSRAWAGFTIKNGKMLHRSDV